MGHWSLCGLLQSIEHSFVGFSKRYDDDLVLGGAFYLTVGYGGGYEDVKRYGAGKSCTSSLNDVFISDENSIFLNSENSDNDGCLSSGRDEIVNLAVFELAAPIAFNVTKNLKVGVSIRLPFGIFEQQTTQDIFGAFNNQSNPVGTYGIGYAQVKSEMWGARREFC